MTTATEIWVSVVGYEGIYEVSDRGRIKRLAGTRDCTDSEYLLKPTVNGIGYQVVSLCRDGTIQMASVHRIVLIAFRGPPPPAMHCNHLNGIRADNQLANLEWTTQRSNIRHSYDVLRQGNIILTEDDVRYIRKHAGTISQRALARKFGMSRSGIQCVIKRRTWRHISDEEDSRDNSNTDNHFCSTPKHSRVRV